ncbi:MAG: hypothetical protein ETSY1_28935 [Candidatus Entotheonella factor]|uniref:DUF58 domain-containing protein n=1 Tax=Entotheonella factor TaxID=1429438 RepID=W4LDU3_ENTF1|nr:MAG: hypothetical protein ETSY1_28935 [Candidatus Entotheonella factor]
MIIDTLLQHVARIPLSVRWLAHQVRLGEHRSHQRGSGLDFDQIREYQPGEPIRKINWAATARRGSATPLVNAYYEEKDLTVMLLADLSASMNFGSTRLTKRDLAAEISASLVYSTLLSHDRVGLLGFAGDVVCYLPPRQERAYQRRIPEAILQSEAGSDPADWWTAVSRLEHWVKRPTLMFLLSDFLADDNEPLQRALKRLCHRHDPIALVVTDPLEQMLPVGTARMVCRDLETGAVRSLSLSRANQRRMAEHTAARQAELGQMFHRLRMPFLTVTPDGNYIDELRQLVLSRHRRASA